MSRRLAIGLLILANTLWGSSYVVAKVALNEVPPPLLAALRFCLASVILWSILLWQSRREDRSGDARGIRRMERMDAVKLVLLGLCGISLSYLLSYRGISLTTATDASLLIVCEVIFTSLLAALILGERFGRRKKLGMIVGIAGVVILVTGNLAGQSDGKAGALRAMGDVLIMGGLLCQALYSVFGTGLSRKYQPLTLLAVVHAGSLMVWVPLLIWYVANDRFPALSLTAGLSVIYLAAVVSVACFFIWFSVLRVTGAGLGAVSLFIQPLVGGLMGILLLNDPITVGLCAGAVLIFAALHLTSAPENAIVFKKSGRSYVS